MTPSRVLPLALALAMWLLWPAAAQFGGMPGMPGSPGMSPGGGMSSPFGGPPQPQQPQQGPPPACEKLMGYRDETTKHGQALQAAGQKKAQPDEVCKLFKAFLTAEGKMLKGLEENSATCGVPPDVIKQVKVAHAKYAQMGKQVCEVAAQGARPAAPSLSDALGTTPTMPDASAANRGPGTFDTLSGNPLQR
jgi:hypothetical protein